MEETTCANWSLILLSCVTRTSMRMAGLPCFRCRRCFTHWSISLTCQSSMATRNYPRDGYIPVIKILVLLKGYLIAKKEVAMYLPKVFFGIVQLITKM